MTALLIISVFVGIYALLIVLERLKKLRIYEARKDESICTFVRSLEYRKIDLSIVRSATEVFDTWWSSGDKKIPFRKDDNVEDFGCGDFDFDDAVEDICKRTQRSLEYEGNPMLGRVHTIGYVIDFVNQQPKISTTS